MRPHEQVIELAGEPFCLLPQKAVYRPAKNQLIIADVHLGKATHFRKSGIAMPDQSHLKDLDTLEYLLRTFSPETVLLLGDLFHSDYNREWLWFRSLIQEFPAVQFLLVEGNHDILPPEAYSIPNLSRTEVLEEEHFLFSHHPLKDIAKLNICGHVHPGIRITGMARQSMKFPCFYLDKTHFILPAFGNLTGLFLLEQEESAVCFIVGDNRVIRL
jgi:DNA ligase-associated metallophosphoesterase